jgi:hypothetical protein
MYAKDLKVGALYEPYVPHTRFFVKGNYLRTRRHMLGPQRKTTARPTSHRFLIYLGEADPSETPHNLRHYFWVFVGNRRCLMHEDKLRAIKPMEEK